jgi:mono/diheme cytochrome c family protein
MRYLAAVGLVLVLLVAGLVGLAYSGLPSVAASADEPGTLRWLLQTTRQHSVARHAAQITVPDLSQGELVTAGAADFNAMCAHCHGGPGREPFVAAGDMSPPPPDLGQVAGRRSPAELFWVIKHGIRMTGMPAWGATHSDAELWELVAFVDRLPTLSPADYRGLVAQARADGHGLHHEDHPRAASESAEPGHAHGHGN